MPLRSLRGRRGAAVAVLLLVLALSVVLGIRARAGVQALGRASAAVNALEPRLDEFRTGSFGDLASLQGALGQVQSQLERARSQLTPFLQVSGGFGWLPKVGARLRSVDDVLDVGQRLVRASQELVTAAYLSAPLSGGGVGSLLDGNRINEAALRQVGAGKPHFQISLNELGKVREGISRLQGRSLPADMARLVARASQLAPEMEALARTGLTAANAWRALLGFDVPRTYLVVVGNADELRPSGGFIPGAWLLALERGEIIQLQFWDTVDVDKLDGRSPLPPEGLLQSIWAGAWLFRDAGWFPDFPLSARVIEQTFKLGQGISVDGVIAVNQWAGEALLRAVGPVTLPGRGLLEPDNYMEVLERATDEQGRAYVDTVLKAVMDRLRGQGTGEDALAIVAALNQGLRRKDIMMSFHDPALQALAKANGWDGAVSDSRGDYLMVADSNVGFSKVDRNIEQRITYQVGLDAGGGATGRLDVLYANKSVGAKTDACALQSADRAGSTYQELKNACYWDYLRVYVPEGSALRTSTPFPMPQGALYRRIGYNDVDNTYRGYEESGKQVFAGLFTVDPAGSQPVAFEYLLPPGVARRDGSRLSYTLLVQKESGRRDAEVVVAVQVPEGYKIIRASPGIPLVDGNKVRFSFVLNTDVTVQLDLEK